MKCTENKDTKSNEESINEFWDNIKWPKIHVIRVPRGGETEKAFQELMVQNVSYFIKL